MAYILYYHLDHSIEDIRIMTAFSLSNFLATNDKIIEHFIELGIFSKLNN